jgi:ribonuclease HI
MFIAAKTEHVQFALDVPSMEATALWKGLNLAEQLGVHSLLIESDSMEVVQAVLNPSEYRAVGAVVIDDCRKKMTEFGKATIMHCFREANVAAHELAHFSFRERIGEVWYDQPPGFLLPFLNRLGYH